MLLALGCMVHGDIVESRMDQPIHLFSEFPDRLITAPIHRITLLELVHGNDVGVSVSRLHWVMYYLLCCLLLVRYDSSMYGNSIARFFDGGGLNSDIRRRVSITLWIVVLYVHSFCDASTYFNICGCVSVSVTVTSRRFTNLTIWLDCIQKVCFR